MSYHIENSYVVTVQDWRLRPHSHGLFPAEQVVCSIPHPYFSSPSRGPDQVRGSDDAAAEDPRTCSPQTVQYNTSELRLLTVDFNTQDSLQIDGGKGQCFPGQNTRDWASLQCEQSASADLLLSRSAFSLRESVCESFLLMELEGPVTMCDYTRAEGLNHRFPSI